MFSVKSSLISGSICVFSAVCGASPVVIDFEDLSPWSTPQDGYGGATGWGRSGVVAASNSVGFGNSMFISAFTGDVEFLGGPVILNGLQFKSYGYMYDVTSVQLFRHGTRVSTLLPSFEYEKAMGWLESKYSGEIDQIKFIGGASGFAIDNLTYSIASVPEPGSLTLAAIGLSMIFLLLGCKCKRYSLDA